MSPTLALIVQREAEIDTFKQVPFYTVVLELPGLTEMCIRDRDEQLPFQFEWDWLAPSGLSTKDFIAPSSFEFRTGKQFRMGKKYGAVSFLQILAPELNDRLLADFLDMESSLIVSMHIQSVDQVKAIKTVKRKITDLDRSKIEEQKKAVRAGYDMDLSLIHICALNRWLYMWLVMSVTALLLCAIM